MTSGGLIKLLYLVSSSQSVSLRVEQHQLTGEGLACRGDSSGLVSSVQLLGKAFHLCAA